MEEEIHEPVSVLSVFDAERRVARPIRLKWHNRVYPIKTITMHYTKTIDGILHHIYAVASGSTFFVLYLNSKTLFWTVEEAIDTF